MPDRDRATAAFGAGQALVTTFNASTGPPPREPLTRRVRLSRQRDYELARRQGELDDRLAQIVTDAIRRFKSSRC